MHFTFDTRLRLPRAQVFAFLGDPRNRTRWQTSIRKFEMLSTGEPRVGMRWRESVGLAGWFEMEICEYAPVKRWAERIRSRSFDGTVGLEFSEADGVTTITLVTDVRCKGLFRLLAPIARLVLRREMRKDLGRVESLLRPSALPGAGG